jgi:hypothetical protein
VVFPDTLKAVGGGLTDMKWEIISNGVYDEDYGVLFMRITHVLTANILKDDKITFDISFNNKDAAKTIKVANLVDEDSSRCTVY